MSKHDDEVGRVVSFRAPPVLMSAMQTAAARDLVSLSDVARTAIVRDLRQRGFVNEPELA